MRFGARLRTVARTLAVPPAARERILEEVASDLEDLYASFRAAGLSEADARARSALLLAPEEAAVAALSDVHRPAWSRWSLALGAGSGPRRVARASIVLPMLVLAALAYREAGGLAAGFLIPIAGIGVAALLRVAGKAVRVWGAGESAPAPMRAGAGDLLVAAVGAILFACFGVVLDLRHAADAIQQTPTDVAVILAGWLRTSVSLTAAGLGVALLCGLAWLALVRRAAGVERLERRLLGPVLEVESSPSPKRRQ